MPQQRVKTINFLTSAKRLQS